MFTKIPTKLLTFLAACGLATALMVPVHAQTTTTNTNTNAVTTTGTVSTGAPIVDATFDIVNTRTNTDATTTPAKPGDILRITAKIRNSGTGTLELIPRVLSEELLKLGQVIDPGNGGLPKDQRAMEFPKITLAAGCNCDENIAFSVQLVNTMCTDFPQLVTNDMIVSFQDKVKRIPLQCSTPAPVTMTPTTTVTPPSVPKTGPEEFLALSLAAAGAGAIVSRRFLRRKTK